MSFSTGPVINPDYLWFGGLASVSQDHWDSIFGKKTQNSTKEKEEEEGKDKRTDEAIHSERSNERC